MTTPFDNLPPLLKNLFYAHEYGLLNDRDGNIVERILAAGIDDSFSRKFLKNRVQGHQIARSGHGGFSHADLRRGDFTLGVDERGSMIMWLSQYLNEHSITTGGSGSGKTTKHRFMVLQLAPLVSGLWLFDFRKREFAILRPLLQRVGVDLLVVPARKLRLNPLQVPRGCDPRDFAANVADALVLVFQLPPVATKLLHASILGLYRSQGVLNGGQCFPTLFDLYQAVAANKSAHTQARGAILAAFEPVLLSLSDVLAYRSGWRTEDLAALKIVFELGGVSETDKNLILITLLVGEFMRRIARGVSNPGLQLLIVCDEAARLVGKSDSCIADMIGLVRGTGIGLDLSVQSAQIAPSILSNTGSKFLGRCGSATDYDVMGAAMGLDRQQRQWLTTHLEPGQFAASLSQGWRHPFLLRIPNMNLRRLKARAKSEPAHLGPLASLPTIVAKEFIDWTPAWLTDSSADEVHAEPASSCPLSRDELDFLGHVVRTPGEPSSRYPQLAKIGSNKAQKIRRRLTSLGYLREERVNASGRGRSAILLFPTDQGTELVTSPLEGKAANES